MRDFFESSKFKILVGFMALLIGAMIYFATTGSSEAADYIFETMLGPVKKLSSGISESVSESLAVLLGAEKNYNENEKLKQQMNELYAQIVDYNEVKRENEELRTMLGLTRKYDNYEFSPPCHVISHITNDPYSSFIIDLGSNDGIKKGDPVVTESGIVGVCDEVSLSTAKVRSLYSPETSIGAYTVRTTRSGIISGGYDLSVDGHIMLDFLDIDTDVEPGDIVVTTGSENFPAGTVIGIVESVEGKPSGLSKYAIVSPAVDPATVNTVFVIINYVPDEATLISSVSASTE